MARFRFTVARWLVATGVLAVNAGLVRAFVIQEMFQGVIVILFALQVGLLCLLRVRGRVLRFWLGFEVAGVASVLFLFALEVHPEPRMTRLLGWYIENAFNFSGSYLSQSIDDIFVDHQDLFLAIVYFLPEFAIAVLCGLLTASLFRVRRTSTVESAPDGGHPSVTPSPTPR